VLDFAAKSAKTAFHTLQASVQSLKFLSKTDLSS
jgi:hypothetical protein